MQPKLEVTALSPVRKSCYGVLFKLGDRTGYCLVDARAARSDAYLRNLAHHMRWKLSLPLCVVR